jgi:cell division cycle 14
VNVFNNIGVTKVIRLNDVKYDRMHFVNAGISHDDLFFVDGSNPPDKIVNEFFNIVEDHFS